MNNPEYIILHHSERKDRKINDWKGIIHYHTKVKKWKDVAYHRGIEFIKNKLVIHRGRLDIMTGAHAGRFFNKISIGICIVGNYDLIEPPKNMLFLLASLCREYQSKFNISTHNVIGHRETYDLLKSLGKLTKKTKIKTCPGSKFDLDSFRKIMDKNQQVYNFSKKNLLKDFYYKGEA